MASDALKAMAEKALILWREFRDSGWVKHAHTEELLDAVNVMAHAYNIEHDELNQIREAINGYYAALDEREHGGIAEHRAFNKIQQVLGMYWKQGETLKTKS